MAKEVATSKGTRFDPLSALWRLAAAPQPLLVLMGLLALALVLGSVIPQIPPQAVDDPQAWLAVQSGLFGQRNGLVRALGLFDLYHAFWFRLLLALTGLILFVRAVESAELAWRATRSFQGRGRRAWVTGDLALWRSRVPQVRSSFALPPDEALARLRRFLAQRRYRLADVPAPSSLNLVVGRRQFLLWAQPVLYGGLLIALIGLAIAGNWGWQSDDWQPAPGESRGLGHDSPYAVRLDAFDLQLGEDGRLRGYRSEITWLKDSSASVQDVAGVGQPATFRGVAVRQVGYVPAVKMRGWDDTDRQLALQVAGAIPAAPGEVEVLFSSPEAQPLIFVPSQDLFLLLAFEPLCAEGRPALHLDVVRDGGAERRALGTFYESGSVAVEGLRLKVDLAFRPILRMDYRPAMGLVVAGIVLAILALAAEWVVPPRLLWLAVGWGEEDSTILGILVPAGLKGSRWLPQLADQLREVLAGDA